MMINVTTAIKKYYLARICKSPAGAGLEKCYLNRFQRLKVVFL